MSKEKQLNEIIEIVKPFVSGCACEEESGSCELTDCRNCNAINLANRLQEANYRKQSEGEWIKTETNYTCSKCNFNVISWSGEYDGYECERGISLMKFCPNCGAKMKGGAE